MMHNRRAARKDYLARIKAVCVVEGREAETWGMVQDKSITGLGILFPKPIAVGAVLSLSQGSLNSSGVVRHCTKMKGRFFVGLEFHTAEDSSKPTQSWTVVAHPKDSTDEIQSIAVSAAEADAPPPVNAVVAAKGRWSEFTMAPPPGKR